MKASGSAVRGLVKSRVEGFAAREFTRGLRPKGKLAAPPPLARSRIPPATQASTNDQLFMLLTLLLVLLSKNQSTCWPCRDIFYASALGWGESL